MKQYTENRAITHEEFASARRSLGVGGTSTKGRKENKNVWRVSIKEIHGCNYNLDFKNPNGNSKVAHKDPPVCVLACAQRAGKQRTGRKEVLETIAAAENQIAKILEEIKKEI